MLHRPANAAISTSTGNLGGTPSFSKPEAKGSKALPEKESEVLAKGFNREANFQTGPSYKATPSSKTSNRRSYRKRPSTLAELFNQLKKDEKDEKARYLASEKGTSHKSIKIPKNSNIFEWLHLVYKEYCKKGWFYGCDEEKP